MRGFLLSAIPLLGTLLMIATKNLTRFGSPEGRMWNPKAPIYVRLGDQLPRDCVSSRTHSYPHY